MKHCHSYYSQHSQCFYSSYLWFIFLKWILNVLIILLVWSTFQWLSLFCLFRVKLHAQSFLHIFLLLPCPRASVRGDPAVHALYDQRARGSVRGLRQEDRGPLLPAGRGQTVAHALPQVLRVQTQPGVGAHLLQQGRQHLLQGGLLQVGGRAGPGAPHARSSALISDCIWLYCINCIWDILERNMLYIICNS